MSAESTVEPGMPEIGSVLSGRYRIVKMLGAGGMGWVFEGVHERLRRPIAIKVLKPALANQTEFQVRFEREARAAALLKSIHAVRVFDVDTMPDGQGMYIVMELLEGRDLGKEAALRSGLLEAQDVIDWIAQSCEALQEAHDAGIVHRDIKPGNIFLSEEPTKDPDGQTKSRAIGSERIAKVVDFGISKFSEHVTRRALTDPGGSVLGTPHYMAPEQLRGHRVDGRADIWALGVTLYRVLGGRLPFTATSKENVSYMSSVLTQAPFPFAELRPDLPRELAHVIMKTLEKRPDDRFASAADFAKALRPFGRRAAGAGTSLTPKLTEAEESAPTVTSTTVDTKTIVTPQQAAVERKQTPILFLLIGAGVLAAILVAGAIYAVSAAKSKPPPTASPSVSESSAPPAASPSAEPTTLASAAPPASIQTQSSSTASGVKPTTTTKPPIHRPSASSAGATPASSSSSAKLPADFVPDHL